MVKIFGGAGDGRISKRAIVEAGAPLRSCRPWAITWAFSKARVAFGRGPSKGTSISSPRLRPGNKDRYECLYRVHTQNITQRRVPDAISPNRSAVSTRYGLCRPKSSLCGSLGHEEPERKNRITSGRGALNRTYTAQTRKFFRCLSYAATLSAIGPCTGFNPEWHLSLTRPRRSG